MTHPVSRRTLLGAAAAGLVGSGLAGPVPATAGPAAPPASSPLRTLDFTGVRLLPSRWKTQQDMVANEYASVPSENYLRGFRLRAGKPVPPTSRELGGWYSDDVFHNFGQIVSGLARLHAGSGRSDLKAKVTELVNGFVECIEPDGWFFYSDQPNSKHYVYEKMVCGLLDAHLYCQVETALPALKKITDWARDTNNLGRVREHTGGWEGEWYTLSENLYRAYQATNDTTYRDFGRVWEYRSLWDRFYAGENYFQHPDGTPVTWYHAYSHVNSLSGLGAGYRVTGDPYYLTTLRNAYQRIRQDQCWSTGGYGPYEQLLPRRADVVATLQPFHNHFETLCGSWAALKVSKYLTTATGRAEYGDWAELMLYNGVGATGPMGSDGTVQYYSAYSPRGGRKRNVSPWSCCTGTRPQGVADYTDQVFLAGADRLLVNLFLPARAEVPTASGRLVVRVVTDFPNSNRVRLVVDQAPSANYTLGFRSPGWLAGPARLWVNGASAPSTPDGTGWITATRRWRNGEYLEVELPMALKLRQALEGSAAPAAVTYGPVSVAYAGTSNPVRSRSAADLVAKTRRVSGSAELAWRADGGPAARPFYAYGLGERYFLHLDPNAGLYIHKEGDWGALPYVTVTGIAGDWAAVEFEGTGVRYHWYEFHHAGIVAVELDGRPWGDIDQHGPNNPLERFTDIAGLAPGRHTLRLVNSGRKHEDSNNITINIRDVALISGTGAAAAVVPQRLGEHELAQVERLVTRR